MSESERLTPTCTGCGCERSGSWLMVTGVTKPGPYPFRRHGAPVSTLLCGDCRVEREDSLGRFIDSLEEGWSLMEQGPELTVLTYPDGRQEIYPTMPPSVTA